MKKQIQFNTQKTHVLKVRMKKDMRCVCQSTKKQYLTTQPPTDVYSFQMMFIVYLQIVCLGYMVSLCTATPDLLKEMKWNKVYASLHMVSVDVRTCLT